MSTLLIGGFFLFNGVLFYFFWNYGKKTAVKELAPAESGMPPSVGW